MTIQHRPRLPLADFYAGLWDFTVEALDEELAGHFVEVCTLHRNPINDYGTEHSRIATFPPGALVGQVACLECGGSGWWGYGPTPAERGPCVECKGSGRVWVGLR